MKIVREDGLIFDSVEIWNLRETVIKFLLPRLEEFRKMTMTYPEEFEEIEEWYAVLEEMIKGFKIVVSKDIILSELDNVSVERAYELFGKYFKHLWI